VEIPELEFEISADGADWRRRGGVHEPDSRGRVNCERACLPSAPAGSVLTSGMPPTGKKHIDSIYNHIAQVRGSGRFTLEGRCCEPTVRVALCVKAGKVPCDAIQRQRGSHVGLKPKTIRTWDMSAHLPTCACRAPHAMQSIFNLGNYVGSSRGAMPADTADKIMEVRRR
jgi:hypothetical protein